MENDRNNLKTGISIPTQVAYILASISLLLIF